MFIFYNSSFIIFFKVFALNLDMYLICTKIIYVNPLYSEDNLHARTEIVI